MAASSSRDARQGMCHAVDARQAETVAEAFKAERVLPLGFRPGARLRVGAVACRGARSSVRPSAAASCGATSSNSASSTFLIACLSAAANASRRRASSRSASARRRSAEAIMCRCNRARELLAAKVSAMTASILRPASASSWSTSATATGSRFAHLHCKVVSFGPAHERRQHCSALRMRGLQKARERAWWPAMSLDLADC